MVVAFPLPDEDMVTDVMSLGAGCNLQMGIRSTRGIPLFKRAWTWHAACCALRTRLRKVVVRNRGGAYLLCVVSSPES